MSFKLIPSLTVIGDALIENYKRASRASPEEKELAGLKPDEEVKAQIGIASVEEYITMSVMDVGRREVAAFDLSQFDQPMRLASLYIDEPNSDAIVIEVFLSDDTRIMKQTFTRNRTPFQFPTAPLPPSVTIKVTALTPVKFIQLVLVPVVILDARAGTKEATQSR